MPRSSWALPTSTARWSAARASRLMSSWRLQAFIGRLLVSKQQSLEDAMRDSSMSSTMRLAAYFNPTGHHVASWRHPRAQVDAHINIRHYIEIAQTAERAKFDM